MVIEQNMSATEELSQNVRQTVETINDISLISDTNMVTIIDKHNNIEKSELKSKAEIAKDIVNKLVAILSHAKKN